MEDKKLIIPGKGEGKLFDEPTLFESLYMCMREGYEPLAMPELIRTITNAENRNILHGLFENDRCFASKSLYVCNRTTDDYNRPINRMGVLHNSDNYLKNIFLNAKTAKGGFVLPHEMFNRVFREAVQISGTRDGKVYATDRVENYLVKYSKRYPSDAVTHVLIQNFCGGLDGVMDYLRCFKSPNNDTDFTLTYPQSTDNSPSAYFLAVSTKNRTFYAITNVDAQAIIIGAVTEESKKKEIADRIFQNPKSLIEEKKPERLEDVATVQSAAVPNSKLKHIEEALDRGEGFTYGNAYYMRVVNTDGKDNGGENDDK